MMSKFRLTRNRLGVILLVSWVMTLITPVFAGDVTMNLLGFGDVTTNFLPSVDVTANFLRLPARYSGVRTGPAKNGPVREARFKGKPSGSPEDSKEFTTDFRIEDCTFSNTGRNPYFSLNPGDVLVLAGGGVDLQVTVLNETRDISFVTARGVQLTVTTRVVEEQESQNGSLIEVSRNFFARCQERNDIIYFGEDVQIFENGTSTAGSWLAGTDGALPGVIMPGTFLLGSRYFQEQAPDVALDRATHVAMGLTVTVPAGTFEDCVQVFETTPLEPKARGTKVYCPGIGLVDDDGVTLVAFTSTP